MMNVLLLLLGLCVLGLLVMTVYAFLKPTDGAQVMVEERSPLTLESLDKKHAVLSFTVPLRNNGGEIAAITDCFLRPYLPQEQFPDAVAWGRVEKDDRRRSDNYFEALVLQPHEAWNLVVTLVLSARDGKDMREVLSHLVDMDAAIYLCGVGRKAHYVRKYFVTILGAEVRKLAGGAYNG